MPVAPTLKSYQIDALDRKEVLRYLGYRGQEVTPELDARLDAAIASCLSIGRARASIAVYRVAGQEELPDGTPQIALEDTALTLVGKSMQRHMAGARKVGVLAVTIGMGVERELKRLSLTDHLGQVLFDAAATTMVERAADAAEATLVGMAAREGLYTNFRFSPGYGDMPLAQMREICEVLGAQRAIGLTVSAGGVMIPRKSVTAILGISDVPVARRPAGCEGCAARETCALRRR